MAFEEDDIHCQRSQMDAVVGAVLRVGLLFGSLMVVAVALVVSHVLDGRWNRDFAQTQAADGLDTMPTGSIGHAGTYATRASVPRPSANGVCVPSDNGTSGGHC